MTSTRTTPTTPTAPHSPTTDTPSRTPLLAAVALGVAVVLNALGSFADLTGNSSAEHGWGDFLTVAGISLVATAVVFGLVVRTAGAGDAGRRALVLGVLAVLSIVVFWAGVTAPLAIGAIACALVARDLHGRLRGASLAGGGLGVVALAVAAVLSVIG